MCLNMDLDFDEKLYNHYYKYEKRAYFCVCSLVFELLRNNI